MKALVYKGDHKIALEDKPKPTIQDPTDAIVKLKYTTICGSDLHILHGHVPTCKAGTTLGHEGVGTIESIGDGVKGFKVGQTVLIACITSCSFCRYCKRSMLAHCEKAGWVLGHTIDGTQAEYVRIPLADSSLFAVPESASDDEQKKLVMLSDIMPTGHEVGVLAGNVSPGKTVAIIGSGPVGLAALLTAHLYSPALLIMIDKDEGRLEAAKKMGAHHVINSGTENAQEIVMKLTNGDGCDTVIEAVGVPETFELCQNLIAFGGTIANIGVHGAQATIHLEKLWGYNLTIAMGFVNTNTTPTLMKMVEAGTLKVDALITHEFNLQKDGEEAYSTFSAAAKHKALKMIMTT